MSARARARAKKWRERRGYVRLLRNAPAASVLMKRPEPRTEMCFRAKAARRLDWWSAVAATMARTNNHLRTQTLDATRTAKLTITGRSFVCGALGKGVHTKACMYTDGTIRSWEALLTGEKNNNTSRYKRYENCYLFCPLFPSLFTHTAVYKKNTHTLFRSRSHSLSFRTKIRKCVILQWLFLIVFFYLLFCLCFVFPIIMKAKQHHQPKWGACLHFRLDICQGEGRTSISRCALF